MESVTVQNNPNPLSALGACQVAHGWDSRLLMPGQCRNDAACKIVERVPLLLPASIEHYLSHESAVVEDNGCLPFHKGILLHHFEQYNLTTVMLVQQPSPGAQVVTYNVFALRAAKEQPLTR